jgi:hypothetical protein
VIKFEAEIGASMKPLQGRTIALAFVRFVGFAGQWCNAFIDGMSTQQFSLASAKRQRGGKMFSMLEPKQTLNAIFSKNAPNRPC